jgi:hypothetical protein
MKLIRKSKSIVVTALVAGSCLFQSCPFSGVLNDCFEEDSISDSEFDDLNPFEQLLYEENSCGRYEMIFDFGN